MWTGPVVGSREQRRIADLSTKGPIAASALRALRLGLADIAVASWALSAAALAGEYDKLDRGPLVGEPIPHRLAATDQTGAARTFESLKGERGLILVFSRSLDWCPYCKREALAWNGRYKDAEALGYRVAVLTYDSVRKLARFAKSRDIGYTLLSDPESEIIRAFDLLNEEHEPGGYAYGIPHPIVFVIDRKGVIRHRFSEDHYSERADIDLVLETIGKQIW